MALFGCMYFVQDLFFDLDKLSPRSIKCIFVGYSRAKKEYRCYSPTNEKYFVFANVMFFESIPYISPQGLVIASDSIPFPPSVPFSTPAPIPVPYVSSPVSPLDTTELLALKVL